MSYYFGSRENGTATRRPKLVVTYTLPGGQADTSMQQSVMLEAVREVQPGAVISPVVAAQPAELVENAAAAPDVNPPATHVWRSYYSLGGQRIAMRVRSTTSNQVYYLFSDHLGSSSVSYRAGDGQTVAQRYYPWGSLRSGGSNALPTSYTFTGQRDPGIGGLMYYNARFYDPVLGRFCAAPRRLKAQGRSSRHHRAGAGRPAVAEQV